MATFYIKQHDLLPNLVVTLLEGDDPVDLTLATGARFLMRNLLAGLKVSAVATILDQSVEANLGKVSYTWVSPDTDTVGKFNGEVEITWPGSKTQTFPAHKYFTVDVQNDLTD